jgi:hypothetical protein
LTPATWPDLEELFGLPGGSIVRGCWCMYYRKTGKDSGLAAPTRVVMRRALRPRRGHAGPSKSSDAGSAATA